MCIIVYNYTLLKIKVLHHYDICMLNIVNYSQCNLIDCKLKMSHNSQSIDTFNQNWLYIICYCIIL